MRQLDLFPIFLSSLFRLFSFTFLRIIPTRLGIVVLPAFYLAYSLSLCLCPPISYLTSKSTDEDSEKAPIVKKPSLISALILSFKTPTSLPNVLNLAINSFLILAAVDLALNPIFFPANDVIFTRIGALYPDAARIVVRYPSSNANETHQDIRVLYRAVATTNTPWNDGPVASLQQQFDWVATVQLENLWPNTPYEYKFATFNRTFLVYPASSIKFRTFPDPRLHEGSHFRQTIRGFDLLAEYIQSESNDERTGSDVSSQAHGGVPSPSRLPTAPFKFMLFLGDFIYADVPMYFGDNREAYRRLYRRNYESPSFRKVYERLPIFHAYDDHEIINNFGGDGSDPAPYPNASEAFQIYNGNANYDSVNHKEHYFDFSYGDTAFFVMDTRRHRTNAEHTEIADRTMLGEAQRDALLNWLSKVNTTCTFKFIVSSVPFTSLWGHDAARDSWAGYLTERSLLLDAFHSVPNVLILSGDRHEFAAIEFSANDPKMHVVRELSTSPLNMFYIPLVRTLRMNSEEFVESVRTEITLSDSGPSVKRHTKSIPREKVLKYIPHGNTKWSAIEIDTRTREKPTLHVDTMVIGHRVYRLEVLGIPPRHPSSKALASISNNVKQVLEKIGFQPKKWF